MKPKPLSDLSPRFADDSHNTLYLGIALGAFFIELGGVLIGLPLLILLFIHLLLASFLTGLLLHAKRRGWDLRLPLLLWVAIVIFGPCGSLGFLCTLLFYSIYKQFSTPFEKWYASLFPDFELTPAGKIYERIIAGWDDYKTQREVISFQDLMHVGTVEQKQTALEMIAMNFNPILAPILKMALDDPSNQIRVQAASIVAKIDTDFEEQKIALINEMEEHPEDLEKLLALADHLDTYAFAGILDIFREKEYRDLAVEYYKKYIEKKPEDHRAWMSLGRLLNRTNAFDQVLAWFEERLKASASIPANSYIWYWEALYMLHSFNKLSDSAQDAYRELLKTHPQKNLLDCMELWANKN